MLRRAPPNAAATLAARPGSAMKGAKAEAKAKAATVAAEPAAAPGTDDVEKAVASK